MDELIKIKKRPALSGWPMILAWLAMLIFAIHASTHMVGAGDTWVAMACGRHFVSHGVDTVEPFSANSHKAGPSAEEIAKWPGWAKKIADKVGIDTVKYWNPTGWINQNWLTHVIFYLLTPKSTYDDGISFTSNALVYWKFVIYILTIICVYYTGRFLGANPALSAVFACFALFVGRSYFDIRPAGFSNLLVSVFLLILVLSTYRNILYIWLIVPIAVFWCNVHGGYIYIFIMLTVFVGLHFLISLPRRWTVSLHSIGTWILLYALALKLPVSLNALGRKIVHQENIFTSISPMHDWLLKFLLVLIVASLVLTALKRVKNEQLYAYHVLAAIVVFACILPRFFPSLPRIIGYYPENIKDQFNQLLHSSLLPFFIIAFGSVGLGVVLAFFKEKLVTINFKGLGHVAAAGFVTLLSTIIFNPFRLTNFTHTIEISLSKHAERWRNVNEWHPAFEWSNPVGTSYPFLILLLLSSILAAFWLFSRTLKPKLLKTSKNGLQQGEERFNVLIKIFTCAVVLLGCWVTFISFAFIDIDFVSFLICIAFAAIVLAAVWKNVHFIYLLVPLILLALWCANPKCFDDPKWFLNVNSKYVGRYIYPFLILPGYTILHLIISLISKKVKARPINILFVAGTAIASLILMFLIFDPFRFKSPGWDVSQIFNLKAVWLPKYTNNARPNYIYLFNILYIINLAVVTLWLFGSKLRDLLGEQIVNQDAVKLEDREYSLPKIDLALIFIAGFTIYMAIRSRRFITIAAIAACPVMAMFTDQMIRGLSATFNYYRKKLFQFSPMPFTIQSFLILSGALVVSFLGMHWGLKFKRVYLDPWPGDTRYNSMFIRMTASDAKPFYAMKFIKDNKLEGKMFNYWTEGGFIAWGQQPDPETGKTSLQLFMDGRAQAAYQIKIFDLWSMIMGGGPVVYEASKRGRDLTGNDYKEIGKWLDKVFEEHKVWIVLMPAAQYETAFVKGMDRSKNWRLIYLDNRQKLFARLKTAEGKKLFDGIASGETVFPNEFTKNLTVAHNLVFSPKKQSKQQALDFAIKAFNLNPSQAPMVEILVLARNFKWLKPQIKKFFGDYVDRFRKNTKKWAKEDGYLNKISAGLIACNYMMRLSNQEKNPDLAKSYETLTQQLTMERTKVIKNKSW